jgi:hypothetical protein
MIPTRDPIQAYERKSVAARRVGEGTRCTFCGEARAEALISGSNPMICTECQRRTNGQSVLDDHHVAGRANSPVTVRVPVNDHRADLSVAQYEWPTETLENRDGSPLLKGAACIRGGTDMIFYVIKECLLWIADMLETLDSIMVATQGRNWWRDTELEKFAPEKSSNDKRKSESITNRSTSLSRTRNRGRQTS